MHLDRTPHHTEFYRHFQSEQSDLLAKQRFRNEGKMRWELGRFSVALKRFWSGDRREG